MALFILDTTVLSNFSHVRRPDLVQRAFGADVATSPAAWAELQTGQALGFLPVYDGIGVSVLDLSEEEESIAATLRRVLDAGEAQCLALAQSRRACLCSDDTAARGLARERGVQVSGTLGALLALVERDELSLEEGEHLLALMRRQGYRSPVVSLHELLE